MDFEVFAEADEPFVTVRVNADITFELAVSFVNAGLEEAIRLDRKGILVDARAVSSAENITKTYKFARELEAGNFPYTMRMAGVIAPDDPSHDFAETVTRNQGVNLKLFKDISGARHWLSD